VKEIVIVPAWRRPEFLQAAAIRLIAAADNADLEFWICLDRGHSDEVAAVANDFRMLLPGRVRVGTRDHGYRGNSFNVLTSFRNAVDEGAELVHLVEEDVLVGVDYFQFHRRAHELAPDAFSVSACRNQYYPLGEQPPQDETAAYLHGSYQSIGVSVKAYRLRQVLAHAHPSYFINQVGYCRKAFPKSKINPSHAEQDGLFHRVLEKQGSATLYASVPRAYHVGFVGYHRHGDMPAGTLSERAAALLAMDADELNRRARSYPDHNTVPLDGERAPVDHLVQWP
jgi:hypothetical protein